MSDIVLPNSQTSNGSNIPINSTILEIKKHPTKVGTRRPLQDIGNTKGSSNISPIKPIAIVASSPHSIPSILSSSNGSLPHVTTSEDIESDPINYYSPYDQHLLGQENINSFVKIDDAVSDEYLGPSPLLTDETDLDTEADSASDYESRPENYNSETYSNPDTDNETIDAPLSRYHNERISLEENSDALPSLVNEVDDEDTIMTSTNKQPNTKKIDSEAPPGIPVAYMEELDKHDIGMVSEYSEDIFNYMRELEVKMLPSHDYMDHQPELEWRMRRILFDWIIQVHERFRMLPETLFLCINYVDRFLSVKEVSIDKLQLVGITALFIAAKYEELDAPTVSSMLYMTDQTYSREELQKAERFLVNMLNYELGFPGPLNFLRRISKSDEYDPSIRTLGKYLIEVTIMYECFIPYPPSLIAAASYYVAMRMLQKTEWTSTHVHFSGYDEVSIIYCASQLLECLEEPSPHMSVYNKYETNQHMNASLYVAEYLAKYQQSNPLLRSTI
ncbi:B-type cyclin [Basidiobolus ranarum]|uniref:B-type cyclin n=1 Tax=Basidiobolus ranarum TaxID=34480 RepID=A0ABR2WA67_9FUNG